MTDPSSFFLKRFMSITGMLPVGLFLVQHFFSNSYILLSDRAFNDHSRFLTSLPMVVLLELGLIYLPILLHAGLGLAVIYRGDNNFTSYGMFRNWMFFLQRLSGILALAFIVTHSYTTRIQSYLGGTEVTATAMRERLADPFWFWFYFAGIVLTVFHFSNGLWSFLITWGITVSRKAQQVSGALTMGFFVAMGLWGIRILLQFN